MQRVDRTTVYLDIQTFKCFFKGVEKVVPLYVSSFKKMPEKLLKKLNRNNQKGTKKALTRTEVHRILDFSQKDESIKGHEDYTIF